MTDLEGLIFKNKQFGYCKVTSHVGRQVGVRFCGTGREALYTLDTLLRGKDFKWDPLPVGLRCTVEKRGECCIVKSPFEPDEVSQVHKYMVEFISTGRETATLTERELWPIIESLVETPLTKVAGLQVDAWFHFRARDDLLAALTRLHKETAGIRALAASRVELLAHQASVIGAVIDDSAWRYILADEVGLGKTIEAGVIVHELLAERPKARVLVLTPGSLARQWLCEMHLSFGGRDFRLADLHDAELCDLPRWSRVICSLKLAAQVHARTLLTQPWDLVVVDEAHHLLWNEAHYVFVKALSLQAGGVLLLSAVPARERAKELLRLLQLIDPKVYADGTVATTRFEELYREQSLIGRRLRILQGRIDNTASSSQEVQQAARRLLEVPILTGDDALATALQKVLSSDQRDQLPGLCDQLVTEVASRYRISRRILKNRRSQLLDQKLLFSVERRLETNLYESGRLEEGARETLLLLLNQVREARGPTDALHIVFRKAVTSLCDPVALMEVARALRGAVSDRSVSLDELDPSAALDYDEHERLLRDACSVLAPHLDPEIAERLEKFATAWLETVEVPPRVSKLIETLDRLLQNESEKALVFAGTLGSAELIVEHIQNRYGEAAVASFRHDLDDNEKEREVTRFRRDLTCRILVSDESGGEGRNFQFASAVVHFDLPWSVAAIEQRIGRLDRIGRRESVPSVVVAARGSIEEAWIKCLAEGFEVFARSISGLEFVLRETEHRLIEHVIQFGADGIDAMVEEVREISTRERASDDADALTDVASFDRRGRRPYNSSHTADTRLEDSFPRYLRTIGAADVAKRVTDRSDFNLKIWRLRPEDVTQVQLPGIHRGPNGQLGEHFGTFLRSVARDRPDLEFFSTGHGLFEAVCSVANTHITGRTFSVQLKSAELQEGIYLLSTWKVHPSAAGKNDRRLGRAVRHLYGRRVRVLVEAATGDLAGRGATQRLESLLFTASAPITDLRERSGVAIGGALPNWSALVPKLVEMSREQAKAENAEVFAGEDQAFVDAIRHEVVQLQQIQRGEGAGLVEALNECAVSVLNAVVELDSLGIVQMLPLSHVASRVP